MKKPLKKKGKKPKQPRRVIRTRTTITEEQDEVVGVEPEAEFVLEDGTQMVVTHKGKYMEVRNRGQSRGALTGIAVHPNMANQIEIHIRGGGGRGQDAS